jgi:hypothetical protein
MNAKSHRVLAGMLTVMLISVCTLLVAEQVSGATAHRLGHAQAEQYVQQHWLRDGQLAVRHCWRRSAVSQRR